MKNYNVAVVGATGIVGESMLEILATSDLNINNVYALASKRSKGEFVSYKAERLKVLDTADFDFSKADIALFSAGSKVSAEYAPKASAAGCYVIDNTSEFRLDKNIPLIVPEVNPNVLKDSNSKIIANPNCSVIQLVVALKPIYDIAGITSINVASYQAVSGSGKDALLELAKQSGELLNGRPIEKKVYKEQIAFNVLPHIDKFLEDGSTKEEMKVVLETQKILGDESIQISTTAVRVPVFFGHSLAVHIETKNPLSKEAAKECLENFSGIEVIDNIKEEEYPTAVSYAANNDPVYVGRIRNSYKNPCGLDFWVVADNVRKGAALNSIQIAKLLTQELLD